MQGTWVRSLGGGDPLEEAVHLHWIFTAVPLPGKILWTEAPGGLQSTGSQRVGHDLAQENKRAGHTVRRAVKLWGDGEIRHFFNQRQKRCKKKVKKRKREQHGGRSGGGKRK